jgi:predicted HTH domain antitoxin
VLEAFRANAISLGRLAEILDLTIDEANGFLKTHYVQHEMTLADVQESHGVLNDLLKNRLEGIER